MMFRTNGFLVLRSMLMELVVSVFREFLVVGFSLEVGSSVGGRKIVVRLSNFKSMFVGNYGFPCSLLSFRSKMI